MTSAEKRSTRKSNIIKRLKADFQSEMVGDRLCFLHSEGFFRIDEIGAPHNALVVEYADSRAAARANGYEDGNLFFMDEMEEEAMYSAMLAEINGEM